MASASPPSMPPWARSPSIAEIERWCCWASTSVGASSAACPPASTTWSIARSATRVLPEPTSPCRRRFIGWSRPSSSATRSPISRWPPVSSNGSRASKAASSPSSRRVRARAPWARCARPAAGEDELEHQRLLEAEPLLGGADLLPVVGGVDPAQRLHDVEHLEPLAQLGGEHVGHAGDEVERGGDDLLQVPGVELGGEGVDRDELAHRDRLVAVEGEAVGLLELPAPAVLLDLAGEDRPAARPELGLVALGQAGVGAEQRDGEVGAVGADRTVVRNWRRLPLKNGALSHERTSPTIVSWSPTTGVATSVSSVAAT